ncbi:MAG: hypothetical protein JXA60_11210 [Candidatus Coatesbacteria bacterium]|nr:hypothetical protein [Candidatus Coatesbacteria bacterium]
MKQTIILTLVLLSVSLSFAVTVAEIRENYSNYENKTVTIEGVITCPGGAFSNATFYIQDSTGGVLCYKSGGNFSDQALGDRGSVTGVVTKYNEEIEISDASYTKSGSGNPPNPKSFTTGNANTSAAEGWLLRISGTVQDANPDKFKFNLNDGSGEVQVYLEKGVNINWDIVKNGAKLTVIGIGSTYKTTHEVKPRYSTDVTEGTGVRKVTWGEIKRLYKND